MMKKVAMLLVFAMLFTLCACNSSQPQNPTATDPTIVTDPTNATDATDATNATDATADTTVTTDATDATDADDAKDPTNATHNNSTVIDTRPADKCAHKYEKATCTKPMTCSKCGATEGKATGHHWKAETCTAPKTCHDCGVTEGDKAPHQFRDGFCVVCNEAAPKSAMEEFVNGWWITKVVVPEEDEYGEILLSISFDSSEAVTYAYKSYYTNNPYDEQVFDKVLHNGKEYLDVSFSGSMGGFEFEETANGNIKVVMMNETEFELTRVTAKQFKVVASNDKAFLPIGTILTNQA